MIFPFIPFPGFAKFMFELSNESVNHTNRLLQLATVTRHHIFLAVYNTLNGDKKYSQGGTEVMVSDSSSSSSSRFV